MAAPTGPAPGGSPRLGISFEGRPAELLAAAAPHVDLIEVVPDCLAGPDGRLQPGALDLLDHHAADVPLAYHGIGLSIGTWRGWNPGYVRLLEELVAHRRPLWHSEHLGFSMVDGAFLGTMGALPATAASVALVADRARRLRRHVGLDLLLEHVATPLARPDEMGLGRFLNRVAEAAGCGILLDLHNLECDADNGLIDLDDTLAELDLSLVQEIHVAGGTWSGGFHLDVHAGLTAGSTRRLLREVAPRCPNLRAVVFELLAEAVPAVGVPAVVDELRLLRAELDALHPGPPLPPPMHWAPPPDPFPVAVGAGAGLVAS